MTWIVGLGEVMAMARESVRVLEEDAPLPACAKCKGKLSCVAFSITLRLWNNSFCLPIQNSV